MLTVIVEREWLRCVLYTQVMRNKTSRACQRRLRYMMRNPATTFNVSVFVGESRQDKVEYFLVTWVGSLFFKFIYMMSV